MVSWLNPSEEIVNAWLNERGFFTIQNIKVGRKEIDILAGKPSTGERLHVEAHISVKPFGPLRAHGVGVKDARNQSLTSRLEKIYNQKFFDDRLVKKATEFFLGLMTIGRFKSGAYCQGDTHQILLSLNLKKLASKCTSLET